jgi:hypothetical protein
MNCGDTFFARSPGTYGGEHLQVVIVLALDHNDTVYLVDVTSTPPDGDKTTVIRKNEHEMAANEKSFVYYGEPVEGSKKKTPGCIRQQIGRSKRPSKPGNHGAGSSGSTELLFSLR